MELNKYPMKPQIIKDYSNNWGHGYKSYITFLHLIV